MDLSQKDWISGLKSNENSVLLDVRSIEEHTNERIPNSILIDINKPKEFLEKLESLDKDKKYYIYCRSGNRSSRACHIMKSMGYKSTYNLMGGIIEWQGDIE
ncbi:MAG: rhodanese [Flavobacteriaceae bacterium]|nr:rhodanese [Flavobacteriaceae bacterium]|tara:strand:+ start:22254 stop:22559 length:306 start_codon:yes stop_codon:yes gene_type:complete